MKKFLLCFIVALTAMVMMTTCVLADTATVNGITWKYTVSGGKASIYNSVYDSAIPSTTTGAITIPSSLGRYPVTSIGRYAFMDCSSLTSITIPDSVTSIGDCAFDGCSGLTSITIPDSVTSIGQGAFSDCSGLTSITIPDSVTSIGYRAFYCCDGLTSITIPDSVTRIDGSAFNCCSSLTQFIVDSKNPSYKSINGLLLSKDGKTLIAGVNGNVVIPQGVTSIGDLAFDDCSGLTSVTIPNSVTSIGWGALRGCPKLVEVINKSSLSISKGSSSYGYVAYYALDVHSGESKIVNYNDYLFYTSEGVNYLLGYVGTATALTLPNNYKGENYKIYNYAFYKCRGLTSVTIPDSVTSIGEGAFSDCYGLTSVTMPDSVTSIGDRAFEYCSGLTGVTIPDSVTSIGYSAFSECYGLTSITIPDSVTIIETAAFYDCSGLTSVTIPNSVTSIGSQAFSGCSSLTKFIVDTNNPNYKSFNGLLLSKDGKTLIAGINGDVVIPDGVTSIKNWAFLDRSGLTSVTIPNSVTSIGEYAFKYCDGLTSVTIGNSVTSIGEEAFSGCSGLTSFMVDSNNPNFKSVNGLLLSKDGKTLIAGVNGDVVIPQGVTSIGARAFSGCSGLTSVTIPNSVTSIGEEAFYDCSGLTSITIPNSVTSIGDYAFYDCSGLMSVTIPDSVTSIGDYAFYDCSGLTGVTIPDSVTSIGNVAFGYCIDLTRVTIGNSVTSIGNYAFEGCSILKSAIFLGDAPRDVGNFPFTGCANKFVIKVKKGTKGWNGDYTSTALPATWHYYRIAYYSSSTNDNFVNAYTLTGASGSVNGSSDDAILESGEPTPSCQDDYGASVWWKWTAPATGTVVFDTIDSDFDTILAVYTGSSLSSLIEVTSDDNNGGDYTSCCEFDVVSGTTYYIAVYGYSYYKGDIYLNWKLMEWKYRVVNGKAEIYGGDRTSAIPETTTGAITIPSSLGGYPVTSIGEYAFYNCYDLTSITIPNSVTSIGASAFYYCYRLTSITIPNSVTSIGSDAFYNCYRLTSITIPNSVTSIGSDAFYKCSGLTSVTIPDSVTSIGSDAFYKCSGLTSITIPNSVKSIGEGAFAGCEGLKSVTIGDSVTSIGGGAFSGCDGLTSVTIPDSVTSIGNSAFSGCSGLTSITIPDSVTSIEKWAFSGCSGLTSITIPDSVTSIGIRVFSDCSGLTSVTIPDSVTSIGNWAFYCCSGLTSVTIPDSVTSIGDSAFNGCSGLTSVSIPNSVTSIGEEAFSWCRNLKSAIFLGDAPRNVGDYIFDDCADDFTIKVKKGTKGWNGDYTSTELPETWLGYPIEYATEDEVWGIMTELVDGMEWKYRVVNGEAEIYGGDWTSAIPETTTGAITIPSSLGGYPVTSIGDYAFYCCSGLTSVTIGDSVTSIGDSAFNGCSDLLFDTTTIQGVKLVDGWVVGYTASCSSVLDLTGVRGIADSAFSHCSGLTSVTIGDSVTSIGAYAFEGCSGLTQFIVGSNNPNYKSVNGLLLSKNGKTLIAGINGDVVIPNSVTSIESYAFEGCSGLTSITIPNSVTSIGYSAFSGCSGLTSITIPDSVTSIGYSAFSGCSGLTSITIPDSVTSIGEYAFCECHYLKSAIFLGDAPRDVGYYPFADCADDFTIKVKKGTKGWNGNYTSTELPETWLGYPIEYATADEVLGIMTELVDGMEWKYRVVNGEAEIYGGDWTSAIPETTTGAITIPSSLGGYSVTSIGDYAFENCSGLTNVTIPDSVTSIGDYAFYWCEGLTSVTIPDSVTSIGYSAFSECYGLTSVTIPNSVTSIGDYAFYWCEGLTSVTIPNSVTSIGEGVFSGCYGLTSVTIGDSVTSIGDYAFESCSGLMSMTIPNSVTSIGDYAFKYCSGLMSVTIPNSVTSIEEGAFRNCYKLVEVINKSSLSISKGSSSYGYVAYYALDVHSGESKIVNYNDYLFYTSEGVNYLLGYVGIATALKLPNNYKGENYKIYNYAFYWCEGLTSVTIPDSVTSIGDSAFNGCSGLTSVTIPDSVTSIGDSAFSSCRGLMSVTIPNSVTSIGYLAFNECRGLTSVTIPNSVTSIGDYAFRNCSGLTSITIPDSVTSIGEGAFCYCDNLKTAIFLGDAPRDVGGYPFKGCAGDFVIKVKRGTKGWNGDYTSTELPETWYGYPIEYIIEDDLYPVLDANATAEDVANALSGSVDENLAKNITSVEMYNSYREWALSVKAPTGDDAAGVEAVMASTTAWISFALDQSKLIANEPVEGDVAIASLDAVAADGAIEFTVNIDKIDVGDGASEENLKKLFKIEGATSLGNDANFSSENVEIKLAEPVNGDVKFKILPKNSPDSFFIRAKLLK